MFNFYFPLGLSLLLSSRLFYNEGPMGPVKSVIFGVLAKKIYAVLFTALIYGCATNKQSEMLSFPYRGCCYFHVQPTDIITKLLSCQLLMKMGKLTFVAYLIHVDVFVFLLVSVRTPYYVGFGRGVSVEKKLSF